jgi:hypothetical protein
MVERKSVKKVKLNTKPVTTPSGRDLPMSLPPIVEVRMMGKSGKMQGERIVTRPARKAKIMSRNIII